jgi:DNA-binding transcriptional regulator YbjK
LIEAAAQLLLEQGLTAISHRAVAARAGLPLASTTYYFASADDLRDEALQHVAEQWGARAGAAVDALPAQLDAARAARAVGGIIGADAPSPEMLLMYERYLEAGRHQRLRPVIVAWNGHLRDLVREVLRRAGLPDDEDRAGLVLAVADGVAVTAMAEGAPPDSAVVAALEQLFSLLRDRVRPMP